MPHLIQASERVILYFGTLCLNLEGISLICTLEGIIGFLLPVLYSKQIPESISFDLFEKYRPSGFSPQAADFADSHSPHNLQDLRMPGCQKVNNTLLENLQTNFIQTFR
jgi:hypothetical protein